MYAVRVRCMGSNAVVDAAEVASVNLQISMRVRGTSFDE